MRAAGISRSHAQGTYSKSPRHHHPPITPIPGVLRTVHLTEREFLRDTRTPMLLDELYSLPHGPICSSTLNGINGYYDEVWGDYIARNGNIVVSVKKFVRDDLDELSNAEIAYLDSTWEQLGWMTASQLRNHSHENCPEYTEIDDGWVPISYSDVLNAFDDAQADSVDREIREMRLAESMLAVHAH